jgi:hypothetical protein
MKLAAETYRYVHGKHNKDMARQQDLWVTGVNISV